MGMDQPEGGLVVHRTDRAPDEHNEIGWFTAQDVLSLRLADPAYCGWIVEALASGHPGA